MTTQIKVTSYQLTKDELVGLHTAEKALRLAYFAANPEAKEAIAMAGELLANVTSRCITEVDPSAAKRAELQKKMAELQAQLDLVG